MTKGVSSMWGIADAGKEMFGFRSVSFYCPICCLIFHGISIPPAGVFTAADCCRHFSQFVPRSTLLTQNLTDLTTSFPMQSPTGPTPSSPQNNAAQPSISGAPSWWSDPPTRKKKASRSKKRQNLQKQNGVSAVAAKDPAAYDGVASSSAPIETPELCSEPQEALCQPKFDLTVPTVIAKAPAWTSADLDYVQDDNIGLRCV